MSLYGLVTLCLFLMTGLVSEACDVHQTVCDNFDTVTHDNGCAVLQCQFGKLVPIDAACGKEIDGICHRVNEIFMKGNLTFQCRQVQVGNKTEYKNEAIRLKSEWCYVDGFRYIHLETTRLKRNRCEEYQCQNGVPVRIQKSCSRSFDGNCHFVGESFQKVGSTYICASSEQDGVTKYKAEPLDAGTRQSCDFENKTYSHLQIFIRHAICGFLQCHNGAVKVLTINCMIKEAPGRCYLIGQRYEKEGVTYQCSMDADNKTAKFEVVHEVFQDCQLPEISYQHLEIFQDGCNSVQCVDGNSTIIQAGCLWSLDSKCYKLDFQWKHECSTFKCTRASDGQYQVIEIETKVLQRSRQSGSLIWSDWN